MDDRSHARLAVRAGIALVVVLSGGGVATAAGEPVLVSPPYVTGGTVVGQVAMAGSGAWTGASTLTVVWRRCDDSGNNCAPIPGATGGTYGLVHDDGGHALRLEVTATNDAGATVATSEPSTVVGELPLNVAVPTIAGDAIVGQAVTTDDGRWYGYPIPIFSRIWQSCDAAGEGCATILGPGERSYLVRHADVGRRLRVIVHVASIYGNGEAISQQTTVVPPARPIAAVRPTASGVAEVGATLTGARATWTGADEVRRAWQRCSDAGTCRAIPGATGLDYRVAVADLGSTLRLTETATNAVGERLTASVATARVRARRAQSLAPALRALVVIGPGRKTIPIRCALDQPAIRTCAVALVRGGKTVAEGSASTPSATATALIVRIRVTPALRRLAATPAGAPTVLTARATQDGYGDVWLASRPLLLARSRVVTLKADPIFGSSPARLRATSDLAALRAAAADASSLICTGHTDDRGGAGANQRRALQRARAVCAYLAKGRKLVTVTRGAGPYQPVASNTSAAGRARNRRVTVELGYWRPDPAGRRTPGSARSESGL